MKILMVHNYLRPPSGENTVFEQERQLLESKGHEVVAYTRENSEIETMRFFEKAMLPLRAFWSVTDHREISRIVRTEKPDVAHFHNIFPLVSPAAYRACKGAGVPVVQTLHHFRIVCPGALLFREGRVCEDCSGMHFLPGIRHGCYRNSSLQTAGMAAVVHFHRMIRTWRDRVDLYIALSGFALETYRRLGFPSSDFYVKTNFLQDPVEPVSEDEEYGIYIGRIGEEKGIPALVDALRKCPEIPFKVIGDGPLTDYLLGRLKERGLENLEYLGVKSHKECMKYLVKARFMVLPSQWYEGVPMVLLEAMSAGKPAIVSNIGVLSEMVMDRINGLVFTPGAKEELTERMKRLHADPEGAREMGKKGRDLFEEKYTREVNYSMLMEAYRKAIEIGNGKIRRKE